ncbi:MAG TPA: hypothetical protein VI391_00850 [Thermoanaerobaculia bacterium]|jgi:hypothetical protein
MTKDQLKGLASRRNCPRCSGDKTIGNALCRRCRTKLPAQMRAELEAIPAKDSWTVARALRAAANYFDVHFKSVRAFGGGKKR